MMVRSFTSTGCKMLGRAKGARVWWTPKGDVLVSADSFLKLVHTSYRSSAAAFLTEHRSTFGIPLDEQGGLVLSEFGDDGGCRCVLWGRPRCNESWVPYLTVAGCRICAEICGTGALSSQITDRMVALGVSLATEGQGKEADAADASSQMPRDVVDDTEDELDPPLAQQAPLPQALLPPPPPPQASPGHARRIVPLVRKIRDEEPVIWMSRTGDVLVAGSHVMRFLSGMARMNAADRLRSVLPHDCGKDTKHEDVSAKIARGEALSGHMYTHVGMYVLTRSGVELLLSQPMRNVSEERKRAVLELIEAAAEQPVRRDEAPQPPAAAHGKDADVHRAMLEQLRNMSGQLAYVCSAVRGLTEGQKRLEDASLRDNNLLRLSLAKARHEASTWKGHFETTRDIMEKRAGQGPGQDEAELLRMENRALHDQMRNLQVRLDPGGGSRKRTAVEGLVDLHYQ